MSFLILAGSTIFANLHVFRLSGPFVSIVSNQEMPSYSLVLEVVSVGVFPRRQLIACMSSPGREGNGMGVTGDGNMEIYCNYVTEIILKNVDAHCSAIIYV